jgi:hypothetical protein
MGRKSAPVEMLYYLPDDADGASGANIGHAQKYPEVFKQVEPMFAASAFKRASDVVSRALGSDTQEWLDYAITGSTRGGAGAIVLRSKKEFDPSGLARLPNAKEGSGGAGKFFTVSGIEGMTRAFAPTNRIVVLCSASVSQAAFDNMLRGNKDNPKAFPERMGVLGKRTVKGTVWTVQLFDAPPPKTEAKKEGVIGTDGKSDYDTLVGEINGSSKGMGLKASLGSRAVRFEYAVTCRDKEAASALAKKFNDSEWAKGDEGGASEKREWKYMRSQFGDQKVAREFLANLGFTSSSDVFVVRSECDTKILMSQMSGLLSKATGSNQQNERGAFGGGGGRGPGGGPPDGP